MQSYEKKSIYANIICKVQRLVALNLRIRASLLHLLLSRYYIDSQMFNLVTSSVTFGNTEYQKVTKSNKK